MQLLSEICQTKGATARELADNQQEVQLLRLWLNLILAGLAPIIIAITIVSVNAIDSTRLDVEFSPPSTWNYFLAEVYRNAGLTILDQIVQGDVLFPGTTGFAVTGLSASTQYWIRMKVSNDSGSTYSAWSNTGTGSTTS